MNRFHIAVLGLVSMVVVAQSAEVLAVPVPNPVISYLLDNNTTPQFGSVTGTLVGPAGAQTSGPIYSMSVPHAYTGNRSLHFDGTDDYMNLAIQTVGNAINGASAITYTGWIYYDQALGAAAYDNVFFLSRHDNGNNSNIWASLRQSGGGGQVVFGGRNNNAGPYQEGIHTAILGGNSWHFVAGILDYANNQVRISVDGGALQTTSVSFGSSTYVKAVGGSIPTTTDWIAYGAADGNRRWKGSLDEIAIYNTALSQAQIDTLFAEGLNPPPAPAPEPASLSILLVGGLIVLRRSRVRSV